MINCHRRVLGFWILLWCPFLCRESSMALAWQSKSNATFKNIRRTLAPKYPVSWDSKPSESGNENFSIPRRSILSNAPAFALLGVATTSQPAHALFDGGIGGLGKTRPETGVVFVDPDATVEQTPAGVVSAELLVNDQAGDVALVSFAAPWPLLGTTTGLEARDLVTSDAAFCQVVPGFLDQASTPKEAATKLKQLLTESVLAPQGKFGMYGAPSSIKVKPVADDPSLFQLTFTALTPGMRESDRKYYVAVRTVSHTLVLLLVGTTATRFSSQESVMRKVAQSWQVTAAPKKATRR